MRTALLLLVCALAAADNKPLLPCGSWLVNNGDTTEVELSAGTDKMDLTCKPIGNTPRQIIFNSRRFDNVKCNATGFSGNPIESGKLQPEENMAHAGWPLTVSCADYCTVTTTVGIEDKKSAYNAKEVHCADDKFDLYHDNKRIDGNFARCNTTGWSQIFPEKSLSIDHLKSQQFECRIAPPRCTFKPATGIKYDPLTKTLTCDGGDTLWKIDYGLSVYETLRCERYLGTYAWKSGENIIADASNILIATCVQPCSVRDSKLRFDKNTSEATCSGGESAIVRMMNSGNGLFWRIHALKCDMVEGWSWRKYSGDYMPLADAYSLRDTDCYEYCGSLGDENVIRTVDVHDQVKVTCADPGFGTVVKSKFYKNLTCVFRAWGDENQRKFSFKWRSENWTAYDIIIRHTKTTEYRLDISCEKIPRTCELPGAVKGVDFDNDKKTLTCQGGGSRAIQINSKLYEYLACDEINGWAGRIKDKVLIADADLSQNVTCVEYCKATGLNVNVNWEFGDYNEFNSHDPEWTAILHITSYGHIVVTCSDPSKRELFYNGTRVDGDSAICSLKGGWRPKYDFNNNGSFLSNSLLPAEFECRPAPTSTTAALPSTIMSETSQIPIRPTSLTTEKTTTITTTTTTLPPSTTTETARTTTKITRRPTKASSEKAEAQSSAGVIAASIGGTLLLVVLIVAAIFVVMRRSKKNQVHNSSSAPDRSTQMDPRSDKKETGLAPPSSL